VRATLSDDQNLVVGSDRDVIAYLPNGQTIGFEITIRDPSDFKNADVQVEASSQAFQTYTDLPTQDTNFRIQQNSLGRSVARFTGRIVNNGRAPVLISSIRVWFQDDQGAILDVVKRFQADSLQPDASTTFDIQSSEDPSLAKATTAEAYVYATVNR
jgi:hypothetical protein